MTSICIICCYFGILPSTFQLWLNTCRYNDTVDFLIFTDDKRSFDVPQNVKVEYLSFLEIKAMIQKKFDFEIALNQPYKLCDFKPAYGEIFCEYIVEYEFWGHCDLDMFFGNIRKFLTEDIFTKYDKILTEGHLTLYRNGGATSWYRTLITNKYQNWKDVFQNSSSCAFDEWGGHCGGGISGICEENKIPQYNERIMADINFLKYELIIDIEKPTKAFFVWHKGRLCAVYKTDDGIEFKEYLYMHAAKRKFLLDIKCVENTQGFAIVSPHNIVDLPEVIDEKIYKKMTGFRGIYLEPVSFIWGRLKKKLWNYRED